MIEIIPAIIPQDLESIKQNFSRVLGLAKKVQVDIVDGKYSPSQTWPFLENQKKEFENMLENGVKLPLSDDFIFQIDILLQNPMELLGDLISIGAKSFVIHIDSNNIQQSIDTAKEAGCEVGLGIKPLIPTENLEPFLSQISFVQFMGNDKVGFNGVSLDEKVLQKIKEFHVEHSHMPIQIDIGVNFDTVIKLKEVGVTHFVSGSTIFNATDPKEAIIKLQGN